MKLCRLIALPLAVFAATQAQPALAQPQNWLARCSLELADAAKPENGKYLFQTRGKAAGAEARAEMDYNTGVSSRAAVYHTDAKDLLNPYGSVSLTLGYVTPGDGKGKLSVGQVSVRAIGKDFKAIPGAAISIKLVIDGAAFGPYDTGAISSGMYSVWLDTAETDGDSKPPTLSPADFAKLAKAIDAMKTVDVVFVREGKDIIKATIPFPQLAAWRDGLAAWAARTNSPAGGNPYCGSGNYLN